MTEITRQPATVSAAIAVGAAVIALLVVAPVSTAGLVAGIVGLATLGIGLARGHRGAVDAGCLALFVGVVAAGLAADVVETTLVGSVACVVAWDLGGSAIDLGEQLGRETETTRLEVVHAVSNVLVGLVTVTLGYGVYVTAADGQPVAALVFMLLAAALVTMGLRTQTERDESLGRRQ